MALWRRSLRLRLSADHDGSHQGRGHGDDHRGRDHSPHQSVRRDDALPRCFVPSGRAHRTRHLVRGGLGGSRQGAARSLRAGHQRALLRHRAVRHVEQRLRLDRQAHHRNRRGELPDRRAEMGRRAVRRRQADVPVADAIRVGQRPDAGGRTAGLRRGERAAEAIQADAAQRLGPDRRPAERAARPRERRQGLAARAGAEDGRGRVLRLAGAADEGQPPPPPPTRR